MQKCLIALVAILATNSSIQVNAADLPRSLQAGETALTLNGWGKRQKNFLQLYVGGLYLREKNNDSQAILSANDPMAIRIHITSKFVSQAKLVDSLNEGFHKSTKGNLTAISNEIRQFRACFSERITKNDIFDIVYIPGHGTVVTKNGSQQGVIKGFEFKRALFGIWLSEAPADQALKLGMLGKSGGVTVAGQPPTQR